MENNEQKEILIEIKRISKNVQFFFWLTVISLGLSLISVLAALDYSTKSTEGWATESKVQTDETTNEEGW